MVEITIPCYHLPEILPVETNIIANGEIKGLASGASTGYSGINPNWTYGNNGGSLEGTGGLCDNRSPLTMPSSAACNNSGFNGSESPSFRKDDFISELKNIQKVKYKYINSSYSSSKC